MPRFTPEEAQRNRDRLTKEGVEGPEREARIEELSGLKDDSERCDDLTDMLTVALRGTDQARRSNGRRSVGYLPPAQALLTRLTAWIG